MNKHYSLQLLLLFVALFPPERSAACGYAWISDCSSQVHLRINGIQDSFTLASCPFGYGFDGIQLGSLQSVSLANAKAITWESCQNNVNAVFLKYRVYEQGNPGGSWQSLSLQQYAQILDGPYTTRYRHSPVDIPLSNGLMIGKNYTIELYLLAEIDTVGDDFIPESFFLRDNNGANFKMSFTYGGASAPPIALLAHQTKPSCNGGNDGKIAVSTYGILTGLFYQWSNTSLNFFQQNNLPAGNYGITVSNALGQSASQSISLGQPAPLQVAFSNVQSVGCNNSPGTATANPAGGTPPYQYLWENGQQTPNATLAFAGNWRLTVTDAHQCTASGSVLIGNTGQVERSIQASICPGSSYILGGQQFTQAGSYNLNIPGTNSCDTIVHLTLLVPEPAALLLPLPSSIAITCQSPQVALCATSQPTATYLWKKDGAPIADLPCIIASNGGQYSLEVTLQGCLAVKSIVATEHLASPDVDVSGTFQGTCDGVLPSWIIGQTSAQSPTFTWIYDGALISVDDSCFFQPTVFQAGEPILPSLTVTDAYGCSTTTTDWHISISQYPTMALEINTLACSSSSSSDGAASVIIDGGIGPYAVTWSNGASTPDIGSLTTGTYCVTVTDSYGCSNTQCTQVPFSMAAFSPAAQEIACWPNPVAIGEKLTVNAPDALVAEAGVLEIYDQLGNLCSRTRVTSKHFTVQIPIGTSPGILYLRLHHEKHDAWGRVLSQ